MKILVLAVLIAAVQSRPNPWEVGKLYRYDVDSYTLSRLEAGANSGSAFKAHFTIRVPSPGRLLAKLEDPKHAVVHQDLPRSNELPEDLKFEQVQKLDQPFEITVDGGRVAALTMPASLPLEQENLLKGLISALQLDLSPKRLVRNSYNGYDKQEFQGLFKKMETDVTGDCETLYNVHPAIPEWRFEIPKFADVEEPIMVSKVKNYGHCHHRVSYHFGVPEGSEWAGVAHYKHEDQLVRRTTTTRMIVGKQGPIYKTEVTSKVHVSPQLYSKNKAEVLSKVKLSLVTYEQDKEAQWSLPEEKRTVNNLLYSVSGKRVDINDRSSESGSRESGEDASKSTEITDESKPNRIRRYAKYSKSGSYNKVTRHSGHGLDTSSASDSTSAFVNDDYDPSQPAYAALYIYPQERSDNKQNPVNAQKLVQDMAQQLQNPNNMPKADFLSKFHILVRILGSMSSQQLTATSSSIESTKSSNNLVKADMWMIYRDAMAQVGNTPAFQQIKSWIETKKIEGEEAAEVVASLVESIRYPTKEIMTQFFKLSVSETVRQQRYLNTTALIAATRFINMAHVNNETAHSYYPSHMYGRLARKHDAFVVEEVLPRLSKDLKQAVDQEDSTKAQVYIKAIGNLGHPEILKVFAPYLEGKTWVSTYLRMQMVKNLAVLAYERNSPARAVLFSILKNTAEPFEVRAAAIQVIAKAGEPSYSMMLAMARMTRTDPSVQIRALLKSNILSAAELKTPRHQDLARKAQAVKWMLTKQEYGKQYSNKYMWSYEDNEEHYGFMSALSYIGSEEFLPKSMKFAFKSKSQGWNKENSISASVSDVKELYKILERHMGEHSEKSSTESGHKYSAKKVSEMLGIKHDPWTPLEGSFTINWMGQQRFFTYTQDDLEQLPKMLSELSSRAAKGEENHYTKVLSQAQVSIMFPVASGMPFIFKYREPMVVHANTKISKHSEEKKPMNIESQIHVTYARNMDGRVGFLDTITNQYASVGVLSKLQIQVPLKVHFEDKEGHFKIALEPLHSGQDDTLVHYSVWPYSTLYKKDSLVTLSQDPATKIITKRQKVVSIDTKFGQSVGQVYHIQGYSYSTDYNNFGSLFQSKDLFTNLASVFYQRDTALTHFNFRYLGKQGQTKRAVLFTFAYDNFYNKNQEASNEQSLVATNMEDVTPNSKVRRDEMTKRVSSGISHARVRLLDFSAAFEGQQQEYVATAAMASNPVNPKIQYAIFLNRNSAQHGSEQINAVATAFKPTETPLNFVEAIKQQLKLKFNADIKYGKSGNGNIHIQGYAERTPKQTEELQKHPLAQQCVQQTQENNFYQDACRKMLFKVHTPDFIKASVSYKEVSPTFRNMTYKAFRIVDHIGYWYTDINPLKVTPDGKIEIESHFNFPERTMDLAISTRLGEVHFNRVPIPRSAPRALTIYTPFSPLSRVMNYYTRDQFRPFCTIDSQKVRTYSNRTYEYTLTNAWHVLMNVDDSQEKDSHSMAVLARRTENKKLELYISYKSHKGQHVELQVKPSELTSPKINTNAKMMFQGESTLYVDEATQEPVFEYYKQSGDVVIFNIKDGSLRAVYDGQRLVVISDEGRNSTYGLCGRMSGDARDDYLTPFGLVWKSEYYGACYALKESDSDPKTLQLQEQAKQFSFQPKNHYTAILPTDEEWRKAREQSSAEDSSSHNHVYKTRSFLPKQSECKVEEQVQYFEDQGQICITTSPLPACQSQCRGEGYKLRAVQVVCGSKMDSKFRMYRDQIRQGQNPKPDSAPEQQPKQYRVPTSCSA